MTGTLQITAPGKIARVLEIFSALDGIRWSDAGNWDLVNHCTADLTADEKLLSHWLCYITERQTAFERVWEVGGYVLSHLVRSFGRDGKTPEEVMLDHMWSSQGRDVVRLKCPVIGSNGRLARYGIDHGAVEFSSRYMPGDLVSIYRTLVILDRSSQRSFSRYIHMAVAGQRDQSSAVHQLAAALQFLTYADIGKVSAGDVHRRVAELPADVRGQVDVLRQCPAEFFGNLRREFWPFKKKRLWCAIRDYLKSIELNGYFVEAIGAIERAEAGRWVRSSVADSGALAVMELPGDVWNNNRTFRDGLFSPHLGPVPAGWDMPQTVREIRGGLPLEMSTFYPEQLDVTFDFVPRMCDRLDCRVCMFGAGVSGLCHGQAGLYCPVVLAACGYAHPCDPVGCLFRRDAVMGFCRSAITAAP